MAFWGFSAGAKDADNQINVVIFAPKEKAEKTAERLPECNDPSMLKAVTEKVKEYQLDSPVYGIISRRKRALIVKNLKNFKDVSLASFDKSSNYEVARELVMTKINYHLSEQEMRLCKSHTGNGIYLLMYPEGGGTRVQILNLAPSSDGGNELSIYYELPATEEKHTNDASVASFSQPAAAVSDQPAANKEAMPPAAATSVNDSPDDKVVAAP